MLSACISASTDVHPRHFFCDGHQACVRNVADILLIAQVQKGAYNSGRGQLFTLSVHRYWNIWSATSSQVQLLWQMCTMSIRTSWKSDMRGLWQLL